MVPEPKMEETISSTKMDIEEPAKAEGTKMDIEEPPTCTLANPCRVLKKQLNYIEFLPDQRYEPISKVRAD